MCLVFWGLQTLDHICACVKQRFQNNFNLTIHFSQTICKKLHLKKKPTTLESYISKTRVLLRVKNDNKARNFETHLNILIYIQNYLTMKKFSPTSCLKPFKASKLRTSFSLCLRNSTYVFYN